jgi:hypothetical protein
MVTGAYGLGRTARHGAHRPGYGGVHPEHGRATSREAEVLPLRGAIQGYDPVHHRVTLGNPAGQPGQVSTSWLWRNAAQSGCATAFMDQATENMDARPPAIGETVDTQSPPALNSTLGQLPPR